MNNTIKKLENGDFIVLYDPVSKEPSIGQRIWNTWKALVCGELFKNKTV